MGEPIVFDPTIHSHLIPQIVKLHQQCITTPPYTIATFLPPLDTPLMTKWWEARAQDVITGVRHIFVELCRNEVTGEDEVGGCVMLSKGVAQTGPFRGEVEKLLVSPEHRKKGIAKRLMNRLELLAMEEGRTLLVLDTITGSPAELVYPKLGYVLVGIIPEYGISPVDRSLQGATIFYKNLLTSKRS